MAHMPGDLKISVVIPTYNEEENLPELYRRLTDVLTAAGEPYELVFVDDGSSDSTFGLLTGFRERDGRVKVVALANNYGQQAAMIAGFEYARGEVVVTMDADLQNEPEDIPAFLAEIAKGHDAVCGWRKARKDPSLTRKMPSYLANRLMAGYSKKDIHDYGCNFKAYNRRMAGYILEMGETGMVPTMLGIKGARNIKEIEVSHAERKHGGSRYTMSMLVALAMDVITGYSTKIFQATMLAGALLLLAAAVSGGYYAACGLDGGCSPDRSPLWVAAGLMVIGGQFIVLGFIGEYIFRMYKTMPKKPMYKVKDYIG